jgi:hypothetical protein
MLPKSKYPHRIITLVAAIVAAIALSLGVAVSVQASYESERAVIDFLLGWNNGQDCAALFMLRSQAMKLGATDLHDRYMREKLAAVRCVHPASKRDDPKPAVTRK